MIVVVFWVIAVEVPFAMPPKTKKEPSKKQVAEKTKKVVEVGGRKTCDLF